MFNIYYKCYRSNEQVAVKTIESVYSTEIKSKLVTHNTTSINIDQQEIKLPEKNYIEKEIVKEISSFPAFDLNPLTLPKRGRAWTRHNAQLGIPVFDTSDARKWSIKEVALYVDKIISPKHSDPNPYEQISVTDRFIDQVN